MPPALKYKDLEVSEDAFLSAVNRFIDSQERGQIKNPERIADLAVIADYVHISPDKVRATPENIKLLTVLGQEIYIDRWSFNQRLLIEPLSLLLPEVHQSWLAMNRKEKKANGVEEGIVWGVMDICFSALRTRPNRFRIDYDDTALVKMIDDISIMTRENLPPQPDVPMDTQRFWRTLATPTP